MDTTLAFAPNSAAITTECLGEEVTLSSIRGNDEDGNGLTETATVELPLLSDMEVDVDLFGEGNVSQYFGLSLPEPLRLIGLNFIPLGDTTGDGLPDSAAFDIDGDGEADPDLPLFPFVAGAENPEVELKIPLCPVRRRDRRGSHGEQPFGKKT